MNYRAPSEKEHEIVLKYAAGERTKKVLYFALGGFLLVVTLGVGITLIVLDKWHGYLLFPFATFIAFLFFSDIKGWNDLYKSVSAKDYKVRECVVKEKHYSAGSTHNVSHYVTVAFDDENELRWKVSGDIYKKAVEGSKALMVDYKDTANRKSGRTKVLVPEGN